MDYCSNRATKSESVLQDHNYFGTDSDDVIAFEVVENEVGVLPDTGELNAPVVIEIDAEDGIPIIDPSSDLCREILENYGEANKTTIYGNQCQICDKKFKSTERLDTHMCDPKKFTFACSKCNKNMVSVFGLTNHLCVPERVEIVKIEIEKKVPRCGRCDLLFESIEELRKHRTVSHNGAKIVTCSICSKSMMARSFKAHKNWHLNQRRKVLCEMCG